QDSCDPVSGCVSTGAPSTACLSAGSAALKLRDSSNFFLDYLKFNWKGGPVVNTDLGNPLETTRYELCIYDAGGIKMALGVPPGSNWSIIGSPSAPRGYRYKDSSRSQAGVRDIRL